MTTSETGEVVTMEISRSNPILSALFQNVVDRLETQIDTSKIEPFAIQTPDEYASVSELVRQDADQVALVETTLGKFKDLAYRVHRAISSTMNRLQSYAVERKRIRDEALMDWVRRETDRAAAQASKLREQAEAEERERLKEQAKQADRAGDKDRARELRTAATQPIVVATHVAPRVPKVAGQTIRKRWMATCNDDETFIAAIGAPNVLRTAASLLEDEFGKRAAKKFADALRRKADALDRIPYNMVKVDEVQISKAADACNGKLDWPGIAVEEDLKPVTRRR